MASNNANVIAFPDHPPKGSRSNGGKSALDLKPHLIWGSGFSRITATGMFS
jgi:hypothetical protein